MRMPLVLNRRHGHRRRRAQSGTWSCTSTRLLLLNLALQLFDGVATYQGLRIGVREAN
ncbi:MAG: hypothetical protein U0802_14485 [Candidatus Binatia bacterium]